jgi:hypothetical protein
MTTRIPHVLAGIVCALALTAGAAHADGGDRETITFSVQNVGPADCPEALFGLSFDLVSPAGNALGTGTSCVRSIDGCEPFVAGCRQTVHAVFTLDFGRGSLTVPMKLREVWPTESSLTQRGTGRIAGGTGDFVDARGRVKGGGALAFTEQGLASEVVYTVHLKGGGGDDD